MNCPRGTSYELKLLSGSYSKHFMPLLAGIFSFQHKSRPRKPAGNIFGWICTYSLRRVFVETQTYSFSLQHEHIHKILDNCALNFGHTCLLKHIKSKHLCGCSIRRRKVVKKKKNAEILMNENWQEFQNVLFPKSVFISVISPMCIIHNNGTFVSIQTNEVGVCCEL